MRNRILLCVTLALSASQSSSAPKPRDDGKLALYLPTKVGDKREFETTLGGKSDSGAEWVSAVETKGDMVIVSFSREEGGPVLYRYGASKDGVFRISAGQMVYDPPYRLLKLPAKEGESWEETSPTVDGVPGQKMKYTTGKEEEVEVPAGKFRAVRVEMETTLNGRVIHTTYWHAVGLGMVKILTAGNKGDRVQSLKSFTPAKK